MVDHEPTRTLSEPETRIELRCPACGHTWSAAAVLHGVWWGPGITPESIAALCYCPSCHAEPPMQAAPPPPFRVRVEADR